MQLLRQLQNLLVEAPYLIPEKENTERYKRAVEPHAIKNLIKNSINPIQEKPS